MVSERGKGTGLKGMLKARRGLMHEVGKQFRKNIHIACLYNYLLEQYLSAQGHI